MAIHTHTQRRAQKKAIKDVESNLKRWLTVTVTMTVAGAVAVAVAGAVTEGELHVNSDVCVVLLWGS